MSAWGIWRYMLFEAVCDIERNRNSNVKESDIKTKVDETSEDGLEYKVMKAMEMINPSLEAYPELHRAARVLFYISPRKPEYVELDRLIKDPKYAVLREYVGRYADREIKREFGQPPDAVTVQSNLIRMLKLFRELSPQIRLYVEDGGVRELLDKGMSGAENEAYRSFVLCRVEYMLFIGMSDEVLRWRVSHLSQSVDELAWRLVDEYVMNKLGVDGARLKADMEITEENMEVLVGLGERFGTLRKCELQYAGCFDTNEINPNLELRRLQDMHECMLVMDRGLNLTYAVRLERLEKGNRENYELIVTKKRFEKKIGELYAANGLVEDDFDGYEEGGSRPYVVLLDCLKTRWRLMGVPSKRNKISAKGKEMEEHTPPNLREGN